MQYIFGPLDAFSSKSFPSWLNNLQISASWLAFLEVIYKSTGVFGFLVVFESFLLFSIVNVTASLTVEIKTILADPFINVLDGKLNKLNKEQVNDILIDITNDIIPESEDTIDENHKENCSK